ncbi:unnamed protein product [Durusdinium trenchii]|uniref:Uncharacterized protein n=1 Tax=Durusdinium trenchii TaxID=1381693 RepID=A0ABP0N7G9_9DINO
MGGGVSAAKEASAQELKAVAGELSQEERRKILAAIEALEVEREGQPAGLMISLSFEEDSDDAEKVKVLATVEGEAERKLDPFTIKAYEPGAIENMCRIMYFQSGIGAQQQRLKLPDGRVVQLEGPDAEKSLAELLGDLFPGAEREMPPEVTINLVFEKDVDAEKLRVLATVLREPEKILDPFTMSISEPSAIENMCRIMYFQSGFGAHQQRLRLPDGRLVQVESPDAEKSLADLLGGFLAEVK